MFGFSWCIDLMHFFPHAAFEATLALLYHPYQKPNVSRWTSLPLIVMKQQKTVQPFSLTLYIICQIGFIFILIL